MSSEKADKTNRASVETQGCVPPLSKKKLALKSLVQDRKFAGIWSVQELISEFGVSWVEGLLDEVVRLSQSERS